MRKQTQNSNTKTVAEVFEKVAISMAHQTAIKGGIIIEEIIDS